jgi:hypothetical protein
MTKDDGSAAYCATKAEEARTKGGHMTKPTKGGKTMLAIAASYDLLAHNAAQRKKHEDKQAN